MSYSNLEPLSKQLTIVIGLTVVGFMAFGLALSFYRNLLFEKTLEDMRIQNNQLRDQIDQGYLDLEYYKSSQYKDKYAKENLGLVRPGEQTLIIAKEPEDDLLLTLSNTEPSDQQEAAYFELLRQMPVLQHWQIYLFHREKIDELKMGL
ncbi:MAG: hypothetical protein KC680_04785 [Candidatus Peregrinibacteria bacterium]|nr:hypothetical protein [Candidatus Peregrinibacteria bacterium]MCB9808391.1 hypothetical protein [Candidatus Peribacteria bacterium]